MKKGQSSLFIATLYALTTAALLLAGASWTVVLTKLYVSAQVALPDWARGRGLAIFLTFIFGATTAGSALWDNPPDLAARLQSAAEPGTMLITPAVR